jgi:hypothetical protein
MELSKRQLRSIAFCIISILGICFMVYIVTSDYRSSREAPPTSVYQLGQDIVEKANECECALGEKCFYIYMYQGLNRLLFLGETNQKVCSENIIYAVLKDQKTNRVIGHCQVDRKSGHTLISDHLIEGNDTVYYPSEGDFKDEDKN